MANQLASDGLNPVHVTHFHWPRSEQNIEATNIHSIIFENKI
jgi:hypothetical protein